MLPGYLQRHVGGKKALVKLENITHITYMLPQIIHGNILTNLKSDNIIQIYPIKKLTFIT